MNGGGKVFYFSGGGHLPLVQTLAVSQLTCRQCPREVTGGRGAAGAARGASAAFQLDPQ